MQISRIGPIAIPPLHNRNVRNFNALRLWIGVQPGREGFWQHLAGVICPGTRGQLRGICNSVQNGKGDGHWCSGTSSRSRMGTSKIAQAPLPGCLHTEKHSRKSRPAPAPARGQLPGTHSRPGPEDWRPSPPGRRSAQPATVEAWGHADWTLVRAARRTDTGGRVAGAQGARLSLVAGASGTR